MWGGGGGGGRSQEFFKQSSRDITVSRGKILGKFPIILKGKSSKIRRIPQNWENWLLWQDKQRYRNPF